MTMRHAVLESVVKAKPASCKGRYLKSVTISSTMGPGVSLDTGRTLQNGRLKDLLEGNPV